MAFCTYTPRGTTFGGLVLSNKKKRKISLNLELQWLQRQSCRLSLSHWFSWHGMHHGNWTKIRAPQAFRWCEATAVTAQKKTARRTSLRSIASNSLTSIHILWSLKVRCNLDEQIKATFIRILLLLRGICHASTLLAQALTCSNETRQMSTKLELKRNRQCRD